MARKPATPRQKAKAPTRGERNVAWIEGRCRVPEGKLVGQPVVLREWQRDIIRGIYDNPAGTRRAIVSFGRKNGKGLALDTPIPTPAGWRTMGDLRQGDYVFGSDGEPTRVSFVSDIHTGLKCWRMTFSDGSNVVADEQHQWLTTHRFRPWETRRCNGSGNGGRPVCAIVTTPQIAQSVTVGRSDGGYEANHKIPCAPATATTDTPLPIDPYVVGAWLGDGTTACARFTCGEKDLPEMTAYLSEGLGVPVRVARYGVNRAHTICTPGAGLTVSLRNTGLLGRKHIPDLYMNAGTAQRWRLLQGLMDTDGTVTLCGGQTTPRCSFTSTDRALAYSVWRVARSLGLKATLRAGHAKLDGWVVSEKFEVSFPADASKPVFRLTRKQALLPAMSGKRAGTLTITGCEPVESVPTRCIQVEAADSLFLCGHGCIPTHNTALAAFLLLLHICGPEARPNSQLLSAAQSKEQAAVLFALAAKMVRLNPELNDVIIVRDAVKQILCPELGTLYKALSAEASTAYGLSPVFAVHDELGQVKGPRSELYEAVETASAAHDNPLSICISTQAPTDADLLSVLIDDAKGGSDPSTKLFLYTADDTLDPFSDEALIAANPALGDFQNAAEVRKMADDASRMPAREPAYRNLILNQRVEAVAPFVSRAVWESNGGDVLPDFGDFPVYAGLDLSETSDLTALVLICQQAGLWHVRPTFWLPEDGLADKARTDRVPYDLWHKQGLLETTPGRAIEYSYVAQRLFALFQTMNVQRVGFDRYNMRHLKPWLLAAGFTEDVLTTRFVDFGQGFVGMGPAVREFEAQLLNSRFRHGGHPVLSMCAANAVTETDAAGNRKLSKIRSRGRIDGLVALAMAIGTAVTAEPPAPVSIWDREDLKGILW